MSLAVKLLLSPLLVAQALRTRARAPVLPEAAGPRAGVVGQGPRLRLLIIGDSSGAGVGVPTQNEALAGHLTRTLARLAQAQVHWQLVARTGVTTAQALRLVREQRPAQADFAVVVLGVNDVVDQVPSARAVAQRAELADWLLAETGVLHVVFAPLPPMHQFPLLPQPLRWVAGSDARRHDMTMARWAAAREDVSHVPIAMSLAPEAMAGDGFHPGEPVYRACGVALAAFIANELWPHFFFQTGAST
jgi:lysophospholipase L1-like esterase